MVFHSFVPLLFIDALFFCARVLFVSLSLSLMLFITESRHGASITVAWGLTTTEKTEDWQWLFESFKMATNRLSPQVLFSDMDAAIIAAAAAELDSVHRLCSWHLSRAVSQHLGKDSMSGFWAAVVAPTEDEFKTKWNAWSAAFQTEEQQRYIASLYAKSHMFANYRLVQQRIFTAGMSSTQRVESENRAMKRVLNSKSSLVLLVQELVSHQQDQQASCVSFLLSLFSDLPILTVFCRLFAFDVALWRYQTECLQFSLYYSSASSSRITLPHCFLRKQARTQHDRSRMR
jgi:MULE transposase domain